MHTGKKKKFDVILDCRQGVYDMKEAHLMSQHGVNASVAVHPGSQDLTSNHIQFMVIRIHDTFLDDCGEKYCKERYLSPLLPIAAWTVQLCKLTI